MIAPYVSEQTWLHRAPAGRKLLAVALISLALGWTTRLDVLLAGCLGALLLFVLVLPRPLARLALYRPLLSLLIGLGLLQFVASGWETVATTMLRLVAMLLFADLVAATTPMLDMMDALRPLFRPLRRFGFDDRRLSLAVALVLRFVPVLMSEWGRREEAWRARTGRRPPLRLLAPFFADMLRMADRVAEAMTARGFDAGSPHGLP